MNIGQFSFSAENSDEEEIDLLSQDLYEEKVRYIAAILLWILIAFFKLHK